MICPYSKKISPDKINYHKFKYICKFEFLGNLLECNGDNTNCHVYKKEKQRKLKEILK